jgi:hypothetical protein
MLEAKSQALSGKQIRRLVTQILQRLDAPQNTGYQRKN